MYIYFLMGHWCMAVFWEYRRNSSLGPEVIKHEFFSQTQNRAQSLGVCEHVSAITSRQIVRFILSLRVHSSFITSGLGFNIASQGKP